MRESLVHPTDIFPEERSRGNHGPNKGRLEGHRYRVDQRGQMRSQTNFVTPGNLSASITGMSRSARKSISSYEADMISPTISQLQMFVQPFAGKARRKFVMHLLTSSCASLVVWQSLLWDSCGRPCSDQREGGTSVPPRSFGAPRGAPSVSHATALA